MFVTKEHAERHFNDWQNKYDTKRYLMLDREPTHEELVRNYWRTHKLVPIEQIQQRIKEF